MKVVNQRFSVKPFERETAIKKIVPFGTHSFFFLARERNFLFKESNNSRGMPYGSLS